MRIIRRLAQVVRHLPGLQDQERLWSLVRTPYHRLLNLGGRGVEVVVGASAVVRIPPEFSGSLWEQYEPETVAALVGWLKGHRGGRLLDVGCSIGILSAVALFTDPESEVIAFDSDLASLLAARRMCRHAPGDRLRVVHGFISDSRRSSQSLASAIVATEKAISEAERDGVPRATRYVCLTENSEATLPSRCLDDLMATTLSGEEPPRATLLKCDVEGAELNVLFGAAEFLRRLRPAILLSVHPSELPSYGHSKEGVEAFLHSLHYSIRCLAIDHEEHWWCEAQSSQEPSVGATMRSALESR